MTSHWKGRGKLWYLISIMQSMYFLRQLQWRSLAQAYTGIDPGNARLCPGDSNHTRSWVSWVTFTRVPPSAQAIAPLWLHHWKMHVLSAQNVHSVTPLYSSGGLSNMAAVGFIFPTIDDPVSYRDQWLTPITLYFYDSVTTHVDQRDWLYVHMHDHACAFLRTF